MHKLLQEKEFISEKPANNQINRQHSSKCNLEKGQSKVNFFKAPNLIVKFVSLQMLHELEGKTQRKRNCISLFLFFLSFQTARWKKVYNIQREKSL